MFNNFGDYVQELENKIVAKMESENLIGKLTYTQDEFSKVAELTTAAAFLQYSTEGIEECIEILTNYLGE